MSSKQIKLNDFKKNLIWSYLKKINDEQKPSKKIRNLTVKTLILLGIDATSKILKEFKSFQGVGEEVCKKYKSKKIVTIEEIEEIEALLEAFLKKGNIHVPCNKKITIRLIESLPVLDHQSNTPITHKGILNSAVMKNIESAVNSKYLFTPEAKDLYARVVAKYAPIITSADDRSNLIKLVESKINKAPVDTLPKITSDMMPKALWDWADTRSQLMLVEAGAIVTPMVAALSLVIPDSIVVLPAYPNDWEEPIIIWCLIVAPVGSKKTSCINATVKIIDRLTQMQEENIRDQEAKFEERLNKLEQRQAKLLSRIERAKKQKRLDVNKIDKLQATLEKTNKAINKIKTRKTLLARRYYTTDATPEALIDMASKYGKISCIRDEFSGQLSQYAQRNQEQLRAFHLQGHVGIQVSQNRIGRGEIIVNPFCLVMIGGVQSKVIATYLTASGKFSDDGLMQRFMIYSMPTTLKQQVNRQPPDKQCDESLFAIFEKLTQMTDEDLSSLFMVNNKRWGIPFDHEAALVFDEFVNKLDPSEYANENTQAHAAKAKGAVARLAAVFQMVEWADQGGQLTDITRQNVERAIQFYTVCFEHAKSMYEKSANPAITAANVLLDKILNGSVANGATKREVLRHNWSGLKSDELLMQGVDYLKAWNILFVPEYKPGPSGGRPPTKLYFNPVIYFELLSKGLLKS